MSLPAQAIESILKLPNPKRCEYTLKRIAEARALYVLADDDGEWSFWADDQGHTSLAIWPEQEFAQHALAHEGDELFVYELELAAFLEEGVPYLMACGFGVAIFPVPGQPGTVDMPAAEFAARLNHVLLTHFGEPMDLPYLQSPPA